MRGIGVPIIPCEIGSSQGSVWRYLKAFSPGRRRSDIHRDTKINSSNGCTHERWTEKSFYQRCKIFLMTVKHIEISIKYFIVRWWTWHNICSPHAITTPSKTRQWTIHRLESLNHCYHFSPASRLVLCSAPSVSQSVFTITEKAPTRAFSWLKVPTSAVLSHLRHY